ncbi:MAG: VapC toxin family PIN domain ribonuclease [Ignavibacteriae bacterium]|nr:VapC toxin family PIN domain ribonuclease [Ignavibacteriota bacterium]
MIVVDTNVIAYLFLKGEYNQNAEKLLKSDSDWSVPILWRSELRSILTLYLRKNLITLNQSYEIIQESHKLLKGNEYTIDSLQLLEEINKSTLSAYDLEFVVLAKTLKTKLVTLDKKIIKEYPRLAVSLKNLK